jgi:outer membrane protein assembly factor BamB
MLSTDCALARTTRLLPHLTAGVLAAAGLLLPGCSHHKADTKPAVAASSAKPGPAANLSPKSFQVNFDEWAKIGYKLDWVGFPFLGEGKTPKVTLMQAYDDLVIAQDAQSTVAAVETSNGQTRWSTQLAGPLTKFIGINRDPDDPGRILISSEAEAFALSTANGNILNRERFARVVSTRPVLMGNLLISGNTTGEVNAHYLGHGVKAWGFATVGAFESNPVVIGGLVAAVSQAGDVLFLSPGGSLMGRGRIFEGLDNDPVADNGLLFIAGRDRSVYAMDTGGTVIWRHRTSSPLSVQPTAHNGVLYVDIPKEGLTAFEEATGKVLWGNPGISGVVIGTRNSKLLVHKGHTLMLVDPAHGDVLESINVPNVVKMVLDKFDDGHIYAVNEKATMAKFIPR